MPFIVFVGRGFYLMKKRKLRAQKNDFPLTWAKSSFLMLNLNKVNVAPKTEVFTFLKSSSMRISTRSKKLLQKVKKGFDTFKSIFPNENNHLYGLRTTLIHPSVLVSNTSYPCFAWSIGSTWVTTSPGSTFPSDISL